jgi:tripartite-type tricarboxylate transporter receptor subunit TctC
MKSKSLLLAVLLGCLLFADAAGAQGTYPSKPIRWIVPYPAGGGADKLARLIAHRLSQSLKQTVVVENHVGASTTVAMQAMLAAPRDGYTVLQTAEQIAVNTSLFPKLEYSPQRDIQFIAPIVRTPLVLLTRPGLPVSDPASLVAYMRKNGSRATYASWGQGAINHLAMAAFADLVGTHLRHIPYPGAAPALVGLLNGDIDLYFSDVTSAMPYIRSGQLRALLVSTRDRLAYLPAVPSVHESCYPGFDMATWQGLVSAEGIPPKAAQTLASAVRMALEDPEVAKELRDRSFVPDPGTPEQFRQTFLQTQTQLGNLLRKLDIRPQEGNHR